MLRFADLNAADLTVSRSGGSSVLLTINGTGEVITLDKQLSSSSGIERIEFADGSNWDRADIEANAWLRGTAGNDTIVGTSGNDIFYGAVGNDTLNGSTGSDTYIYASGDGNDLIDDEGNSTAEIDVLRLSDLNAGDLTVSRSGSSNVVLTVNATGHVITLDEQLYSASSNYGIDRIEFADGSSWNRTDIASKAWIRGTAGNDTLTGSTSNDVFLGGAGDDKFVTAAGGDTFIYASGDGNDFIDEESSSTVELDTLRLADLNASDVTVSRSGLDLLVAINGTGHVVEIDEHFYSQTQNYGIERIEFADGTVWNRALINANAWIRGSLANDTIVGTAWNDSFYGAAGDDAMSDSTGSDTYIYAGGDGNDRIVDTSTGTGDLDTLRLQDLNLADVAFSRTATDLRIKVINNGQVISVVGQFSSSTHGIERILFADGSSYSRADLAEDVTTYDADILGTPSNDVLNGSNAANVLAGGLGDDTLSGQTGSDIYLYNLGDGADQIFESSGIGDSDKLIFGTGLNASNVIVTRSTSDLDDVTLTFAGQSGSVFIDEQLYGSYFYGVEQITFGDGIVWGVSNLKAAYLATIQTSGNDIVYGFSGNDTFAAGTGNDRLEGLVGSDTYNYNLGDGADQIFESSGIGDSDKLIFGTGLNASDVIVTRSTSDLDDVTLTFAGQSGSVFIDEQLYGSYFYGVEQITFGDGTIWTKSDLLQNAWFMGTTGNDTINGSTGDDRIDGGGGNDTLSAGTGADRLVGGEGNDTLSGGTGGDTFYFASGFGVDRIADFIAGTSSDDVIEFDDAVFSDLSAVLAAASQSGSDTIISFDGGNSLKLTNVSLGSLHADDFRFV